MLIDTPAAQFASIGSANGSLGGRDIAVDYLAAHRDPAVSRALNVIHTRYAEELHVSTLACEAGVSRTVLAEKFNRLLGESPMRYCSRWRLRVAAGMLRHGSRSAAEIAFLVGFGSEAAFNRAFRREYGKPPIAWSRCPSSTGPASDLPEQQVR